MKIGVIGGGQLAQMLALAGYPLGLKVIALEPHTTCPAGLVTTVLEGRYDDLAKLTLLAERTDLITYEFENISLSALTHLIKTHPHPLSLFPNLAALGISQDRLQEKLFFDRLHIPTTHYIAVETLSDLKTGLRQIGFPALLKTRRLGYDGKGQYMLKSSQDITLAWQMLQGQALLLENKIAFEREVSCIGVRNTQGETAFYALVENQHRNGILRRSQVLDSPSAIEQLAQNYVHDILKTLDYVGVITVEFFQRDKQLIANEIAPRVHNSGHWTIEGANTSQFENHLRAICGLPLGSTKTRGKVVMLNLLDTLPDVAKVLAIPYVHYHCYGKKPRPGRKLGHITVCGESTSTLEATLEKVMHTFDKSS